MPITESQRKRQEHKAKFKLIGEAITAQKKKDHSPLTETEMLWRDRLEDHEYEMGPAPSGDSPDEDDKHRLSKTSRNYGGPDFRVVQFIRTIRMKR